MTAGRTTLTRELVQPPPMTGSHHDQLEIPPGRSTALPWQHQTRLQDLALHLRLHATCANVQRQFGRCVCACVFTRASHLSCWSLTIMSACCLAPSAWRSCTGVRGSWSARCAAAIRWTERSCQPTDAVEGISQTFWATVTVALIETTADQLTVHMEPTIQGDHMILRLRIRVPKHVPIDAEYEPQKMEIPGPGPELHEGSARASD